MKHVFKEYLAQLINLLINKTVQRYVAMSVKIFYLIRVAQQVVNRARQERFVQTTPAYHHHICHLHHLLSMEHMVLDIVQMIRIAIRFHAAHKMIVN